MAPDKRKEDADRIRRKSSLSPITPTRTRKTAKEILVHHSIDERRWRGRCHELPLSIAHLVAVNLEYVAALCAKPNHSFRV